MELIERHDGSEEEKREVEVVLDQIHEAVVAVLFLAVLQSKAHAAHDGEAAASVKQDILKAEGPGYKTSLKKKRARDQFQNQNVAMASFSYYGDV